MARPTIGERRIRADDLARLIAERGLSRVEIARRLSGEPAKAKRTQTQRGQLLKYLRGETQTISEARALAVSKAIGVDPDDWSTPITEYDVGLHELEKLRRRMAADGRAAEALEMYLSELAQRGLPRGSRGPR